MNVWETLVLFSGLSPRADIATMAERLQKTVVETFINIHQSKKRFMLPYDTFVHWCKHSAPITHVMHYRQNKYRHNVFDSARVIVLHWVCCSICLLWRRGAFWKEYVTSGWVCYREQVVDTCGSEPQMLAFLITSTSLSSKDFLKITVSFSFVTGKTCPGKEPEDVLLSNFYF